MALQKTYPNEKIESGKKEVNINDGELLICPANYFSPIKYDIEKCYLDGKNNADKYKRDPHTFCIHRFNASWTTRPSRKLQLWDYFKKRLQETLASLSKK